MDRNSKVEMFQFGIGEEAGLESGRNQIVIWLSGTGRQQEGGGERQSDSAEHSSTLPDDIIYLDAETAASVEPKAWGSANPGPTLRP